MKNYNIFLNKFIFLFILFENNKVFVYKNFENDFKVNYTEYYVKIDFAKNKERKIRSAVFAQ